MRTLIPLLLAALASACAAGAPVEPTVAAPLNASFTLAVGETADVRGTDLRIRLDAVGGDSRCPVDVACVWQGDATVRLAVSGAGEPLVLELHTGVEPRAASAGDYRVALEALAPAPRSDLAIPADAYTATLRVAAEP